MTRGIYTPLNGDVKRALIDFAEQVDRDPRFQAARFVREGLVRAGALPPAEQKTAPATATSELPQ